MAEKESLNAVFAAVGERYGRKAKARFGNSKMDRMRTIIQNGVVSVRLPDFYVEAPAAVWREMAHKALSDATGKEPLADYRKGAWRDFSTSDKFTDRNQRAFVERYVGKVDKGSYRSLWEYLDDLVEMGLIDKDRQLVVSFYPMGTFFATNQPTLKTALIDKTFDSILVPDYVLTYLLYVNVLRIQLARESFLDDYYDFSDLEQKYPRAKEAQEWLAKL